MHSKNSFVTFLAFVIGALSPASATVINTYSDLADWEGVSTDLTVIPFSSTFFGSSLTLSGATFTTSSSDPFDVMDTSTQTFWNYGTGLALEIPSNNLQPILQVALPTGVTSFGLNLTTVSPYNDTLIVTVNGVSYSITSFAPSGGFAFFGATFDAPITSFTVTSTAGDYLFADNISFGTSTDTGGGTDPSPTPEVASLLMIGSGLIGMRWAGKRAHLLGA